jgi:hypothetical protein
MKELCISYLNANDLYLRLDQVLLIILFLIFGFWAILFVSCRLDKFPRQQIDEQFQHAHKTTIFLLCRGRLISSIDLPHFLEKEES